MNDLLFKQKNIESLVQKYNDFLFREYGVKIEKSRYYLCNDEEWATVKAFCGDGRIRGVYIVDFLQAFIPLNSEDYDITFIHEYFGHGLFTEKSFLAQREGSLKYTNQKQVKSTQINRKNLDMYGFFDNFFDDSEGFAVWMTYFLLQQTDELDRFYEHLEKSQLRTHYKHLLEKIVEYESIFTPAGVFKKYGIDVKVNDKLFLKILRNILYDNFHKVKEVYLKEHIDEMSNRKKYNLYVKNDNVNSCYTSFIYNDCWLTIELNSSLIINSSNFKPIYRRNE